MGYSFKRQKSVSIINAFQKILNESGHKPNTMWVEKAANSTIDEWYHGYKAMISKCIQQIMKKNFTLKDLLEPWRVTSTNIWLEYQKNVSVNVLADIFHEWNNIYHTAIKVKPFDVNFSAYIDLVQKIMINILNLNLVIRWKYQNTKIFLWKVILQIGLKKFLWFKK